jgi:tRNA-splicing ligase RtcB
MGTKKITDVEWELEKTGDMQVPGKIFASAKLMEDIDEKVKEQITNVACLPGIQKASMAMPDAHWGYGFPIGGVGAFDPEEGGVICMGGIGFDISCGVRSFRTDITRDEIMPKLGELVDRLFEVVPAGLGSTGKLKLNMSEIDELLVDGAKWVVEHDWGREEDLRFVEDEGAVAGANPENVSDRAKKRQFKQIGTLGSGNHYLEVQYVEEIYDEKAAEAYGLKKDAVVLSLHCGSRALGHQIGTDYLKTLGETAKKYKIPIKDRELACAPINSPEGQQYFSAVNAGINCALANRQAIAHLVREGWAKVLPDFNVEMLYDISHNTCKVEEYTVDGNKKKLYVHRKGATRAFGPGRKEVTKEYRDIGQPVLIGGTMGTCSYILKGTKESEEKSFASSCHGAGRQMSRKAAKKKWYGKEIIKGLERDGILVRTHSSVGAAEEAPGAYKDVNEVIDTVHNANLARKVVQLRPVAVIKG